MALSFLELALSLSFTSSGIELLLSRHLSKLS